MLKPLNLVPFGMLPKDSHVILTQLGSASLSGRVDSNFDNIDSTELISQYQPWQIKLKEKLIKQLKLKDLEQIVNIFIAELVKDNPRLEKDHESIVHYLIIGQGNRHMQIAQFLTAVHSCTPSELMEDSVEELLSYLLQTLVRKDREGNDQGLTRILLDALQIVDLVIASRTSTPYLPSNSEKEHKNGQQDSKFQNIGHFLPETGEFDETAICEKIAIDLLYSLGEKIDGKDPLGSLASVLRAYKDKPENSPLQALRLKHDTGHNPLHIDSIANLFYKRMGDLLWIYVYGGDKFDDWLYTSERDIDGLIRRYERDIKPKLRSSQPNLKTSLL